MSNIWYIFIKKIQCVLWMCVFCSSSSIFVGSVVKPLNFSGGVGCILGSTGGYIVGFLFSTLAMWATERFWNKSKLIPALSMILGLLICYVLGTIWFMLVYAKTTGAIGIWTALGWCVFPYIIPDIIKIILALALRKKLSSVIK